MFFTNTFNQCEVSFRNNNMRNFKPHAKFSEEEDELLREVVSRHGENEWNLIANYIPGRNARQCKERWNYYLSPSLNTSAWTQEEDHLLLSKQQELGSRWVQISKFFNNRTDAMVKNRFHVLMRQMKRGQLHLASPNVQPTSQVETVSQESSVESSPSNESIFGNFDLFISSDELLLDDFVDYF